MKPTTTPTGRIIAATKSYLGAENDTTMITRDKSIWRIQNEEPWTNYKYSLYNADGSETEYEGAWLVVDGGYPKVNTVVTAVPHPSPFSRRSTNSLVNEGTLASGCQRSPPQFYPV